MSYSLFASRTFWTVVANFVVVGGNAIVPFIPSSYETVVVGLLGILAIYFHVNPSQTYNTPS